MNIRRAVFGFVAITLAIALVELAIAGDGGDTRKVWTHSKGSFVQQGDMWSELGRNGNVRYRFVELSRSESYVRLLDKSRRVQVLLANDACYYVELGKGDKKTKLYNGSWQR